MRFDGATATPTHAGVCSAGYSSPSSTTKRRSTAYSTRRDYLDLAVDDPDALVVVLICGLVNLRRNRWTFGAVPLDIDDDRALDTWADIAEAALEPTPPT